MVTPEYPFTKKGLEALCAQVSGLSNETRLVGERKLGTSIRPAAALIRLPIDSELTIVTVDFPRGTARELGRTILWKACTFFDEPVLEACQIRAAVDGALTLEDVAPLFDGIDSQPFRSFVGSQAAREGAYERMRSTVLQLHEQQV